MKEDLEAKHQEIERLKAELEEFGIFTVVADAPVRNRPKRESDRAWTKRTVASRLSNRTQKAAAAELPPRGRKRRG